MRVWGEEATDVKMPWPRLSSWNLIHTNAPHCPFAPWIAQIRLQHPQVSKYKLIANQLVWHPEVSQLCSGRNCDCWPDPPNWHMVWWCCHGAPGVQDGLALTLQAQAVEGNTSALSHNLAGYKSPLQCCQKDSFLTVTATSRAECAGNHYCPCPNLHIHWMLTALSAGQPRNGIFSRQTWSHTSLQKCTDQTNACQTKVSIFLKPQTAE